jgi:transposase InsO family protein
MAASKLHADQPDHQRPSDGGHPQPRPAGAIFRSDRGAQHSSEFARFGASRDIRASLGKTGVCNAAAESFLSALKIQMYQRQAFPDRARARFAFGDYCCCLAA